MLIRRVPKLAMRFHLNILIPKLMIYGQVIWVFNYVNVGIFALVNGFSMHRHRQGAVALPTLMAGGGNTPTTLGKIVVFIDKSAT